MEGLHWTIYAVKLFSHDYVGLSDIYLLVKWALFCVKQLNLAKKTDDGRIFFIEALGDWLQINGMWLVPMMHRIVNYHFFSRMHAYQSR